MVSVAVIGHRGKLGRVVARRWAEYGAEVRTTELRYTGRVDDELVRWASSADYVVNCAMSLDPSQSLMVNGLLPVHLGAVCERVIHPSTDAIGERSTYATSKRVGDQAQAVIIRSSLIGSGPGPMAGATNVLWNGVTTLTWADVAWEKRDRRPGIITLASEPPVSRWELYSLAAELFGHPRPVRWEHPAPPMRLLVGRRTSPIADQLAALAVWEAGR